MDNKVEKVTIGTPPPDKAPAVPEQQPVAQGQQSLAERIRQLFNQDGDAHTIATIVKHDIEESKATGDPYEQLVEKKPVIQKGKEQELVGEIKRIIGESKGTLQDGRPISENTVLPQFTWDVIKGLNAGEVKSQSIPLLTALVGQTLDQQVLTKELVFGLAEKVLELRYTDTKLARRLLSSISREMTDRGWEDKNLRERMQAFSNELDRNNLQKTAGTEADSNVNHDSVIAEAGRVFTANVVRTRNLLKDENLRLSPKALTDIQRQADEKVPHEVEIAYRGSRARFIDAMTRKTLQTASSTIIPLFDALVHPATLQQSREDIYSQLKSAISSARSAGILAPSLLESLDKSVDLTYENLQKGTMVARHQHNEAMQLNQITFESDEPEDEKEPRNKFVLGRLSHGGVKLLPEQFALFRAIYFPDEFVEYAQRYVNHTNNEFDWRKFYFDVQDIIDEILEVAEIRPHEYFQEALPGFYQGHLFNEFIESLGKLGQELYRDGKQMLPATVKTDQIVDVVKSEKIDMVAQPKMAWFAEREVALPVAISNILVQGMTDRMRGTEFLHNVNTVVQQGQGFEALQKYADNFDMELLDWMFQVEPELSEVINLYLRNFALELSTHERVAPATLGKINRTTRLDEIGSTTLYQLLVQKGDPNDPKLHAKYRRLIRQAQAITKGVSGEFWTVALTCHMPLDEKRYEEKGKEWSKIERRYTDMHDVGIQKMMTSLDMYKTLERFGVPGWLPIIGYIFQPIDTGHHAKIDYNFVLDHKNIFLFQKHIEHAIFRGQTDWMAEKDELYRTFGEDMSTHCVGLFARGSWRFIESEALYKYDSDGNLMFEETLNRMKRVGSYLIKEYIDKMAGGSFKQMPAISYRDHHGHIVTRELTEKEKKDGVDSHLADEIKEYMYESLLYGHLFKTMPSMILQLERRRYTPEAEDMTRLITAKKLVSDLSSPDLGLNFTFSPGFVNDHLLPTFGNALAMIEQKILRERREKYDETGDASWLNYELTQDMILSDDNMTLIKRFYDETATGFGESGRHSHRHLALPHKYPSLTNEQLKALMGNFISELKTEIGKERHRRNNTTKTEFLLQGGIAQRLSKLMVKGIGRVGYDIGGFDFDFSSYLFQASGKRAHSRMMHETYGVTGMTEALSEYANGAMLNFASAGHKTKEAVHKAAQEQFVPILEKIKKPIVDMAWEQGMGFMERLIIYTSRTFAKDLRYKTKFIGDALQFIDEKAFETRPNASSEYVVPTLKRPSTNLDIDMEGELVEVLGNGVKLPFSEVQNTEYETKKIFGISFPVPVKKSQIHHKYNMHRVEKAIGYTRWNRIKQLYIPLSFVLLALVIAHLAKQAKDATKKK